MQAGLMRECLDCGMQLHRDTVHCLKCDALLADQSDGSILTVDIAHHGERVSAAVVKLNRVLDAAREGYTRGIRLIVGHGLIRDEVTHRLRAFQHAGRIRRFEFEGDNRGVLLISVR